MSPRRPSPRRRRAGGGDDAARGPNSSAPRADGRRSASRGPQRGARTFPPVDPERTVYGSHPVLEALRGCRSVHLVHGTEAALRTLGDQAGRAGAALRECSADELTRLAGSPDHQGLVAEVDPFPYCAVADLAADDTPDAEAAPFVLALDQVTDPHNLGAIARVADAAGASGLVIPLHRAAHVTAAVCKASAGAVEHVRIARCTNLADALVQLKSPSVWVYGASERGQVRYDEVDLAGGSVIVLGSEGAGLRPRVRSQCDMLIRVPMAGAVSSLNVSTVAAVIAFEAVRQRAVGDDPAPR